MTMMDARGIAEKYERLYRAHLKSSFPQLKIKYISFVHTFTVYVPVLYC